MPSTLAAAPMVSSHAQPGSGSAPFMTCQMLVHAPDGNCVRACGLLDSDPSTSFTSKCLHVAQSLRMSPNVYSAHMHLWNYWHVSGFSIAICCNFHNFTSSLVYQEGASLSHCCSTYLPTQPVHFNAKWSHLNTLHLADPNFCQPNKIDILLGVDVYADVLLNGGRVGHLAHL